MASQAEAVAMPAARQSARSERIFYTGMALAILIIVSTGFGSSYYLKTLAGGATFSALVHLHATVFSLWVLLFCVQTTLVAAGHTALHRRLGVVGGLFAGAMVCLGVVTAIYGARRGHSPGGPFRDSLSFLIVGLTDIALFAGFVAAGFYYRRRREAHKRLMLLATIGGLMWPAITRLPYVRGQFLPMFGLIVLLVLAGPIHDWITRRRVHPVYIWGGLLILASFPLRRAIGNSEAWRSFAAWLIG